MAVPTWVVGQVLTASDVNTWFVPLAGYKTAITTRTTLTKTIDPDLQVTLAASSIYEITAALIYASGTAMDYTFTVPAGSAGGYSISYNLAGTGPVTMSYVWGAVNSAAAVATGAVLHGMISVAGTSGTFGVSWASSSGPASLTMGVGSILTARRVG